MDRIPPKTQARRSPARGLRRRTLLVVAATFGLFTTPAVAAGSPRPASHMTPSAKPALCAGVSPSAHLQGRGLQGPCTHRVYPLIHLRPEAQRLHLSDYLQLRYIPGSNGCRDRLPDAVKVAPPVHHRAGHQSLCHLQQALRGDIRDYGVQRARCARAVRTGDWTSHLGGGPWHQGKQDRRCCSGQDALKIEARSSDEAGDGELLLSTALWQTGPVGGGNLHHVCPLACCPSTSMDERP